MIRNGRMPLYEPGLQELVERNMHNKRLRFADDIAACDLSADIVICAVATPTKTSGETDLSDVYDVARLAGKNVEGSFVFVIKSTVPVGTTRECKKILLEERNRSNKKDTIDVVFNPEFLRQGSAIKDTLNPDRIVVGIENNAARQVMEQLYGPLLRTGKPLICMDISSAELTKYAANAFLSTKISFINELAELCDARGADVRNISEAIGLDRRIGPHFLRAGIGYGGSCLGKDNKSLIYQAEQSGCILSIIRAVEKRNEKQKTMIMQKLKQYVGDLSGKKIAVLGLSFKPKTDDLREAPSHCIVDFLRKQKARVSVYDPVSTSLFMREHKGKEIVAAQNVYDAALQADAVAILAEWDEFRTIDFMKLARNMNGTVLIDGRNMYDPSLVKKAGLTYSGIGVA